MMGISLLLPIVYTNNICIHYPRLGDTDKNALQGKSQLEGHACHDAASEPFGRTPSIPIWAYSKGAA